MQLFLSVIEEGGFTAAGAKLHMAQPAVSIAVRKLEDNLGCALLSRHGRKLELTHEGQLFLRHARFIRAQIDELDRELRAVHKLETGEILVGAPPLISAYILPPLAEAFLRKYPGVRIRAVEANADTIIQRVRSGELDLGLVAKHEPDEILENIIIREEPIVACVPRRSSLARLKQITWNTLLDQPLVLFPKGFYQRKMLDDFFLPLKRTPHVVLESESARFLAVMIAAGRGISVFFGSIARDFPGLATIPIVGSPAHPISIVRRRGGVASQAVTPFIETLIQTAAQPELQHPKQARPPANAGRPKKRAHR